jgi:hypothetical protein
LSVNEGQDGVIQVIRGQVHPTGCLNGWMNTRDRLISYVFVWRDKFVQPDMVTLGDVTPDLLNTHIRYDNNDLWHNNNLWLKKLLTVIKRTNN